MSDKILNILWIDDQHEKLPALHMTAKDYDIKLFPYKSMNGGCEELEKNYNLYDAVLLDAKFFENEDDEPGTEDTKWVHRAKDRILQLPKKFEYFVLTGQAKTYASEEFKNAFPYVFEKGKNEDEDKLFEMLVKAANNQEDTQIRHEHQSVFDILASYDPGISKIILDILKGIRNGANGLDDELYFTQLRMTLESLFRKANQIGLLHDSCIPRGKVNLTDSSLFLAGNDTNHCGVKCSKTHFPKIIAENVKSILFVTGAASHTSVVDITKNMDVQEYRRTVNTPYLLYSLTYQLMDILIWFDQYSKRNADMAINKGLWQEIEFDADGNKFHSGSISRIAPNGWGTVIDDNTKKSISIYRDTVIELKLEENDRIKFTVEEKAQARKIQNL